MGKQKSFFDLSLREQIDLFNRSGRNADVYVLLTESLERLSNSDDETLFVPVLSDGRFVVLSNGNPNGMFMAFTDHDLLDEFLSLANFNVDEDDIWYEKLTVDGMLRNVLLGTDAIINPTTGGVKGGNIVGGLIVDRGLAATTL